ncbi:hypothetical protein [Nocardia sp. NPDC006630]|uniref:hypothetical protein n=1 Tax=Nocardia sp. NPDC006630 TaxID=3157181 RepID=UPI0033B26859
MTTTSDTASSSPTRHRRIPEWDKGIAVLCLALAFLAAVFLMGLTGMFVMAGDSCAPGSPCMDEVGRGINVSLLGMGAVLVIGLGCVIIAAITRTRLVVWALATLLLVPVPCFIGSNIANHAMHLSRTEPSLP